MKKKKEIIQGSTGDTVRITDFIKDPEELARLQESVKRIEHLIPEEVITQGSKKMKQLLEDARRDKRFQDDFKKVKETPTTYTSDQLNKLYELHLFYLKHLFSFRKVFLSKNKAYRFKKRLCVKYGIDPELFDAMSVQVLEGWDFDESSSGDVCVVEPQNDKDDPVDIHTFHTQVLDDIERDVYPVNIKIHRFASKRDVLDFIEKKWDEVMPFLDQKRTRQRKISRSVLDYIWKNRSKKSTEIIKLLHKEFPEVDLAYYEVNKIISEERKRRNVKK